MPPLYSSASLAIVADFLKLGTVFIRSRVPPKKPQRLKSSVAVKKAPQKNAP